MVPFLEDKKLVYSHQEELGVWLFYKLLVSLILNVNKIYYTVNTLSYQSKMCSYLNIYDC